MKLIKFYFNLFLQHHCRCCGRTLCHEHSSNYLVCHFYLSSPPLSRCLAVNLLPFFLFFLMCARARINQSRLCRSLEYSRMLEFVLIVLMILLGKFLFNFIEFLFLVSKFNCTNMPFYIFPVMRKCSLFFMLLIPWACFSACILVLDCYVNILSTVAVPLSTSRTAKSNVLAI